MDLDGKGILLIRLSSLGDLVLVLPAFWALRQAFPRARISWLVREDLAPVIEGTPGLDEVIAVRLLSLTDKYRSPQRVAKGAILWLKAVVGVVRGRGVRPYEVALDLQGFFKSAFFAFLLGKERYGFSDAKELGALFLNRPLFPRDRGRHAVDNYLEAAARLGAEAREARFPLFIPEGSRWKMKEFLQAHGISPQDFICFMAPTARWETKFWSQEGFARVADELSERYNARVILSGLPQEKPYIEGIVARMRRPAVIAAGLTGIKDFFALLELSRLYVGVDSGAMHVARALGVPAVVVFGPSNPSWIGPYGQRGGIVRAGLPCSPCNRKRCRERSCMEAVTPEMVLREVEKVLSEEG